MSLILPYRIAFEEDTGEEWTPYDIVELIMNVIFFVDIILNFFTAYYDENENLELDKKVCWVFLIEFRVFTRKSPKNIFSRGSSST